MRYQASNILIILMRSVESHVCTLAQAIGSRRSHAVTAASVATTHAGPRRDAHSTSEARAEPLERSSATSVSLVMTPPPSTGAPDVQQTCRATRPAGS
jgi:hypothetical protein